MINRITKYISGKHKIVAVLAVVVVTAMVGIASRWWYGKPTDRASAVMEELKYYVVTSPDGKDSLYMYAYNSGDTILAMPTDTAFLTSITRRRCCSWVNRFWFPSCFGTLASKTDSAYEAMSVMKSVGSQEAYSFLCRRYDDLTLMEKSYDRQLSEIDYYLKTHRVDDEGFDIVARRRETVCRDLDSIAGLKNRSKAIIDTKGAIVQLREYYTVTYDSLRMPAMAAKPHRRGFLFFTVKDGVTPDNVKPVYAHAGDIGYGMKTCKPLVPQPDTIVVGRKTAKGRYQGMISVFYPDGSYYEGQCCDTSDTRRSWVSVLPDGFGVGFTSQKVKVGKWQSGKYRGEQPVYTSSRIYGIDISRYQHEPSVQPKRRGRKKRRVTYPIEWGKLRITSLGKLSEKRIDGTVDYPISFIYIKCSEGKSLLNAYYKADCAAARKHGYRIGAYHFFSTKVPVKQQVSLFLKNCNYRKGDLPPALDVEPSAALISSMGGPEVLLASVREWLTMVERSLGVRPILYASQNFINKYLTDSYTDGRYLCDNYQVWIARYGQYKPDVHLAIWQLSPDGKVSGIRGDVDINVFNGYDAMFSEFGRQ